MKYIKSSGGYYYKELSNGKRTRVSAEEYNTKKQKFQNEQEGGFGKIEKRELKSEVKDNLKLNKKINRNFKDIKNKQDKFDIVLSKIDKDISNISNDISKLSNSNNYKEDFNKIIERKEQLLKSHKENNDKILQEIRTETKEEYENNRGLLDVSIIEEMNILYKYYYEKKNDSINNELSKFNDMKAKIKKQYEASINIDEKIKYNETIFLDYLENLKSIHLEIQALDENQKEKEQDIDISSIIKSIKEFNKVKFSEELKNLRKQIPEKTITDYIYNTKKEKRLKNINDFDKFFKNYETILNKIYDEIFAELDIVKDELPENQIRFTIDIRSKYNKHSELEEKLKDTRLNFFNNKIHIVNNILDDVADIKRTMKKNIEKVNTINKSKKKNISDDINDLKQIREELKKNKRILEENKNKKIESFKEIQDKINEQHTIEKNLDDKIKKIREKQIYRNDKSGLIRKKYRGIFSNSDETLQTKLDNFNDHYKSIVNGTSVVDEKLKRQKATKEHQVQIKDKQDNIKDIHNQIKKESRLIRAAKAAGKAGPAILTKFNNLSKKKKALIAALILIMIANPAAPFLVLGSVAAAAVTVGSVGAVAAPVAAEVAAVEGVTITAATTGTAYLAAKKYAPEKMYDLTNKRRQILRYAVPSNRGTLRAAVAAPVIEFFKPIIKKAKGKQILELLQNPGLYGVGENECINLDALRASSTYETKSKIKKLMEKYKKSNNNEISEKEEETIKNLYTLYFQSDKNWKKIYKDCNENRLSITKDFILSLYSSIFDKLKNYEDIDDRTKIVTELLTAFNKFPGINYRYNTAIDQTTANTVTDKLINKSEDVLDFKKKNKYLDNLLVDLEAIAIVIGIEPKYGGGDTTTPTTPQTPQLDKNNEATVVLLKTLDEFNILLGDNIKQLEKDIGVIEKELKESQTNTDILENDINGLKNILSNNKNITIDNITEFNNIIRKIKENYPELTTDLKIITTSEQLKKTSGRKLLSESNAKKTKKLSLKDIKEEKIKNRNLLLKEFNNDLNKFYEQLLQLHDFRFPNNLKTANIIYNDLQKLIKEYTKISSKQQKENQKFLRKNNEQILKIIYQIQQNINKLIEIKNNELISNKEDIDTILTKIKNDYLNIINQNGTENFIEELNEKFSITSENIIVRLKEIYEFYVDNYIESNNVAYDEKLSNILEKLTLLYEQYIIIEFEKINDIYNTKLQEKLNFEQKEANAKQEKAEEELNRLKQQARDLKSKAKEDLEKQDKEKKEQIRQRQSIADELATLILQIQ